MLLAVVTVTFLTSPRVRGRRSVAANRRRRWPRERPREVVAEVVHVPRPFVWDPKVDDRPEKDEPATATESIEPAVPRSAPVLSPPATDEANPDEATDLIEPAAPVSAPVLPPPATDEAKPVEPTESTERSVPVSAPALEAPPTDEVGPGEPAEEFCQIGIWRGYAKARFFAKLEVEGGPDGLGVAESRPFLLRGNGIPRQTGAAEAAFSALLAELAADGWEPVGEVDPWYAARFRRSTATPDQH